MKSVYRQFTDRIAADAAQASNAHPDIQAFAWLAGTYHWHDESVEFAVAPYGLSVRVDGDPQPFLIYHAASGFWLLVLADPGAYGILIGQPMNDGQARFTGDVKVSGKRVQLRQTWRIAADRSVEVQNERLVKGRWTVWDRETYPRPMPPNEPGVTEPPPFRKEPPPAPTESR